MAAPSLRSGVPVSGRTRWRWRAMLVVTVIAAAAGFAIAFAIARGDRTHVPLRPAVVVHPGPAPITPAHLSGVSRLPGLVSGGAPKSAIQKLPSKGEVPRPKKTGRGATGFSRPAATPAPASTPDPAPDTSVSPTPEPTTGSSTSGPTSTGTTPPPSSSGTTSGTTSSSTGSGNGTP